MKNLKMLSNAKINLDLKIVGIKDGYHLLESTFVPIDLYDELTISYSSDQKDSILGMDIMKENNLIFKALKLVKEEYNIKDFITINVNKKIPMCAGVGGGSSNAAFTIKMLNTFFDLKMTNDKMIEIGKKLGSDVPFFIINKPSFVTGRGEYIEPLTNFKQIKGILIFDNLFFSTKEMFLNYDNLNNIETNKKEYVNDLEKALDCIEDGVLIKEIKNELYRCGAVLASMSGSGGSVFGIFETEEDIDKAYNILVNKYQNVWKFKSL